MPQPRFDPRAPRATRLRGVELWNFKSIRHAVVDVAPLTLVAGSNSAGKSTLLQAVLALTQVTRRRIDGHRFPLNDDLVRLGLFEGVRHQRAEADEVVGIATRFTSTDRDLRAATPFRGRSFGATSGPTRTREVSEVDVRWVVEWDEAVKDQIGAAQIAAIELEVKSTDLHVFTRLERTAQGSGIPKAVDRPDDDVAFTGTLRAGDTETPVLDALISSGQIGAVWGIPPSPASRIRDWFLALNDSGADGGQLSMLSEDDGLFEEGAPDLDREKAVQQAAWAVEHEVPAEPDFIAWYGALDEVAQEQVEQAVLEQFVADQDRRQGSTRSEARVLQTRGATQLYGAQAACSRFLSTRVRYIGPLRHAPHLPFPSAPDPDLDDVGISGEHVASVLQANQSIERPFPVPEGGVERLTVLAALTRWLAHFGLADHIAVREDMPLVLGIDVVPSGLERAVPLGAVGVGVSQVLPVIVQCLVAGPGALIVLEQPELHLHPGAQQRLGDFLLACSKWGQNLLVESHSEYLVLRLRRRVAEGSVDKDQLALLFAIRDEQGSTTYQPVELTDTGAVVEWPEGFFDQGPDEAHQLLIAAAKKQRSREEEQL